MAEGTAKSPVLGKPEGKTLINVTTILNKVTALEQQVQRIPQLEARITALEAQMQQQTSQQQQQGAATTAIATSRGTESVSPVQSGLQDVERLWSPGVGSTGVSQSKVQPLGTNIGQHNPALDRYSSEMNLVQAIKDVQRQTGHEYPPRSLVAQHMIQMGTNDKFYTFRAICRSAESSGLVELGSSGVGSEWITVKKP